LINTTPFSLATAPCEFILTADRRRQPQTFLPRDPRGKKPVNRFAIKNIYVQV
jgi:hypothetical protein